MIATLRRIAATLLAAATLAVAFDAPAATQYSPDYTDAWQVPGEAGYGVFVNQQGSTMFVALFVYGGDTLPRWYFASGATGTTPSSFTGTLYRTTGTAFNAPWVPSALQIFPVGSLTLTFASPTQGSITYTVDNLGPVTKTLVRNSLPRNSLAGSFGGGVSVRASNCSSSVNPGLLFFGEAIGITDAGGSANPVVRVDYTNGIGQLASCTFSGTYVVNGRMGNIENGTFSCVNSSNAGTFSMSEIQVNQNGFSAKINFRDQFCQSYVGFIGGVRAAQ